MNNTYRQPDWADGQITRMSGLVEDTCKHGVGHPNQDWLEHHPDKPHLSTHGCDGCCAGDTMKNGDSSSGDNLLMGTLHFYDRVDMNIAAKSMDWALSMWGLNNELRGKVKYGEESEDYINGVQWARNQLHEQLEEHGVSLEDIV
ncbi:hypothetical protein [uncultured Mediterranean phage uvDeep-CGR2-KM18-C269]|nr:hypothetical protein [uncultured Mediterranean phage uvDeep-CGR2-KM18-C269]